MASKLLPTRPEGIRNRYCEDPEERVIRWQCPCCKQCWRFVASRGGRRNGLCVFGGTFGGFVTVREP